MPAAAIGRRSDRPQVGAADEVQIRVIEVVVGPVVDRDALRRQAVPRLDVEREERGDRRTLVMTDEVAPHLSVIVRQPLRIGWRFREQEQPRVLVRIAGEEHHFGRLKELLAIADVCDAAGASLAVHINRGRNRARDCLEAPGRLRAWNRGNGRGVLRVDVAAAHVAEAVVHAARSVLIRA
jgi:hypothetical protein